MVESGRLVRNCESPSNVKAALRKESELKEPLPKRAVSLGSSLLVLLALGASVALLLISFPQSRCSRGAAWFSLVPWLLLILRTTPRRALLYSWIFGSIFFFIGIRWMRFVTIPGWVLLSLYLAAYFALFGFLYRLMGCWGLLSGPFLWVGLELARARLLTGFPWFSLGYSQATILPVIQVADFGSFYAVSFVVVLVNLALVEIVLAVSHPSKAAFRRAALATAAATVLVLGSLAYGWWRLGTVRAEQGPSVAVVQGNIPQSVKESYGTAYEVLIDHIALSDLIPEGSVDMILWPETMVLVPLNVSEDYLEILAGLAREKAAHLLVGAHSAIGGKYFNSAYLFSDEGALLDRYDKLHLVPFGEYVPLSRFLSFISKIVPYEEGLSPGVAPVLFSIRPYRFSVLICYEDTIPELVRAVAPPNPGFLVNITNDGWFRGSAELEQHLEISSFRAIETRTGLVRAANTGISAIISPTGKIEEPLTGEGGLSKEVEGVLTGHVAVGAHIGTPYIKVGDLFAWSCAATAVCMAAAAFAGRLRHRRISLTSKRG